MKGSPPEYSGPKGWLRAVHLPSAALTFVEAGIKSVYPYNWTAGEGESVKLIGKHQSRLSLNLHDVFNSYFLNSFSKIR
jgi:hypothetical protein